MINKITVAVSRMDSMVAFYGGVLDIELKPQVMLGHTLFAGHFGQLELMLCPKELAGVRADINTIQVRFVVDDVGSSYERGITAGGLALQPPSAQGEMQQACLRDPDGNSLELSGPANSADQ